MTKANNKKQCDKQATKENEGGTRTFLATFDVDQAIKQPRVVPSQIQPVVVLENKTHLEVVEALANAALDSVTVLHSIATDEDARPQARVAAAVAILDRAGYSKAETKSTSNAGQGLSEMTGAQIAATVEKARLELLRRADAAKIIT